MVAALLALALVVVILVMVTLGAVLLVRFVLGSGNRGGRVIAAALGGPMIVILPIFLLGWSDNPGRSAVDLVAVFVILLVALVSLGWPVAHFATRRLDRLTGFDPKVFE
ncbi:MAG: hypothetical protein H2049_12100 [Porphyrobacter sp.]|nr:hypothetical protein [Porphyrobacter sp.]